LPDGHALIATRKQLQEADAEGQPLWSVKWDGFLWDAHTLHNGCIVTWPCEAYGGPLRHGGCSIASHLVVS